MNQNKRIILWSVIAVAGLLMLILSIISDPHRGWIGFLCGFIFFTPMTCGLITWSAIVKASHGSWPGELERIPLSAIGCMIPVFLSLILLWIANPIWAPWEPQQLNEKFGIWFNPAFLFSRDFIALGIFWLIALRYHHRRVHGPARKYAAWLIIVYSFAITLIAFDLIMGLTTRWRSSAFGIYIFITGLYAAAALWTILSVFSKYPKYQKGALERTSLFSSVSRLHDLGKLVFTFTILSAYILFCQLLPVWYENIPPETTFLIPRMNFGPWSYVSILLLIAIFIGPILYLLPLKVKLTPWLLCLACSVILICLWIERLWLILPTYKINSLSWSDFGALFALSGTCALCMEIADRFIPLSFPKEDDHG